MRKCKTLYCRNRAAPQRTVCWKCHAKKKKENTPFRYAYNYHKQNAKRRNIRWSLSFNQFKDLWIRSGKWEKKMQGESWEMHRLEEDKGYEKGNIVIIRKTLHVEITAIERGWLVDFRYKPTKPLHPSPFDKAPF